ncbi:MAG: McrC family protein [Epsilonproteobacteria bacterium]|nr:McrC family protein [Campylobacterota bacterium]
MKKINNKHFQIIEYEEINKKNINKKYFKELEEIAQTTEFLSYSKKGVLKSQNYVGIIQTKSGFVLEIFPKISVGNDTYKESKIILIEMIKTLKNHPFKKLSTANLKTEKMSLLEIFVSFFLNELDKLVKKGIKRDYISIQENQKFLKGKLLINEHIKNNLVHKERFFVEYDEYIEDILENRVIKTTLKKLNKLSKNLENQRRIREFMFVFDDVGEIRSLSELKKIHIDRSKKYYENVIEICKVFLDNKSFTPYKGENISFAILFDMNKLFESFVGYWFKKYCDKVKLQHKKYYLFDVDKKYRLTPDIVIENKIFDTKWKIIESLDDILGNDFYQMFAYSQKYSSKEVTLIFPRVYNIEEQEFGFDEEYKLKVRFIDLKNCEKEVKRIIND